MNQKYKLDLLVGGKLYKLSNNNLDYYYDNMVNYSQIIKIKLKSYMDSLEKLSEEIESFCGDGKIHGCIVDIDYYNHVFLNPYDGTLTPYYALDTEYKYVYKNIRSLLSDKRQDLLKILDAKNNQDSSEFSLVLSRADDLIIFSGSKLILSKEHYKISGFIKALQYLINSNIIRIWLDDLLKGSTKLLPDFIDDDFLDVE